MLRSAPAARFFGRRFFAFFALLAMFAQSVVAIAPLSEGRTARMSSHVESHGTPAHFTHNESTCAACQARSLQAPAPTPSHPPVADACAAVSRPCAVPDIAAAEYSPQANPRAPPTLS